MKGHLFADIFARDLLDFQGRELVTISALASMAGTGGQLYFHLGAALNTGLTEAQLRAFIAVLQAKVGQQEAQGAGVLLDRVLASRG